MKTIIAGTDFTPSSVNACKYAALLAQKLHCKLTIFNMFEAPVIHSNAGLYGLSYSEEHTDSQAKTQKLINQLGKLFPNLQISSFVTNGSFKHELEKFSANHQVELAVMGLETKNRISKFIFGSHGVSIAGKINTPVIIVPEKYKKHKFDTMLLAVDNAKKLHKSTLAGLERFLSKSHSQLHLLHVRTEREILDTAVDALKIAGSTRPVEIIKAKTLEDGVKKYSRKNGADLVTIISREHSVFYDLFLESNTKKIAFAAEVPVMAIHE